MSGIAFSNITFNWTLLPEGPIDGDRCFHIDLQPAHKDQTSATHTQTQTKVCRKLTCSEFFRKYSFWKQTYCIKPHKKILFFFSLAAFLLLLPSVFLTAWPSVTFTKFLIRIGTSCWHALWGVRLEGRACGYEIKLSIKSKTIAPANRKPGFAVCSDDDVIMRRTATDLKNSHTQMHIHI